MVLYHSCILSGLGCIQGVKLDSCCFLDILVHLFWKVICLSNMEFSDQYYLFPGVRCLYYCVGSSLFFLQSWEYVQKFGNLIHLNEKTWSLRDKNPIRREIWNPYFFFGRKKRTLYGVKLAFSVLRLWCSVDRKCSLLTSSKQANKQLKWIFFAS